jgi:hypothetical protein
VSGLLAILLVVAVVGLVVGLVTLPTVRRFWLWLLVIDVALTVIGFVIPQPRHLTLAHLATWINSHAAVPAILLWIYYGVSFVAAAVTLLAVPATAVYAWGTLREQRRERQRETEAQLRHRVAVLERRDGIRRAAEQQQVPPAPPPVFPRPVFGEQEGSEPRAE